MIGFKCWHVHSKIAIIKRPNRYSLIKMNTASRRRVHNYTTSIKTEVYSESGIMVRTKRAKQYAQKTRPRARPGLLLQHLSGSGMFDAPSWNVNQEPKHAIYCSKVFVWTEANKKNALPSTTLVLITLIATVVPVVRIIILYYCVPH